MSEPLGVVVTTRGWEAESEMESPGLEAVTGNKGRSRNRNRNPRNKNYNDSETLTGKNVYKCVRINKETPGRQHLEPSVLEREV